MGEILLIGIWPLSPLADPGHTSGLQTDLLEHPLCARGGKREAQVMGEIERGHGRILERAATGGLQGGYWVGEAGIL